MALDNLDTEEVNQENSVISELEERRKSAREKRGITNEPEITVNDMFAYTPEDMAPIGVQARSTYFTAIDMPIEHSGYSGSVVGRNPSYTAPQYIPFGLYDARQEAVQKAAMAKAQADQDFMLKMQKSPVTKLSAAQPQLEKQYYDWLNSSISDAQRRYGKNWRKGWESDTKNWEKKQSFETIAKYNDDIVDMISSVRLDESQKGGNRYVPQEARELTDKILSGYAGLGDPNAPSMDFQDVAKMKTYQNYGDVLSSYDKVIEPLVNETLEKPISRGIYNIETLRKDTNYPQLKGLAKTIKNTNYRDSNFFTEDKILKDLENFYLEKHEKKISTERNRFEPRVSAQPRGSGSGANQITATVVGGQNINAPVLRGAENSYVNIDDDTKRISESEYDGLPESEKGDYRLNTTNFPNQNVLRFNDNKASGEKFKIAVGSPNAIGGNTGKLTDEYRSKKEMSLVELKPLWVNPKTHTTEMGGDGKLKKRLYATFVVKQDGEEKEVNIPLKDVDLDINSEFKGNKTVMDMINDFKEKQGYDASESEYKKAVESKGVSAEDKKPSKGKLY